MLLLQRRSRRSLALQGASNKNLDRISSRRQSLDKAASRRSLDSRQNSREAIGLTNGHQKPEGTSVNPEADIERGQTHVHDDKRSKLPCSAALSCACGAVECVLHCCLSQGMLGDSMALP